MAKKRAPGGGRKKKSTAERKSEWLQFRTTTETRALLESDAEKSGRSLSEEIAARIKRREPDRDPAMKALCFLIAEAAYALSGSYDPDGTPTLGWRSTPFMFEAFKLTVIQLLDALRPPGEITPPISNISELAAADPWSQSIARSFASPEARARDTFMFIWQKFQSAEPLSGDSLTGALAHRRFHDITLHYQMPDARRDLNLSNTGGDK
jgi:hypothetical protein